VKQLKIRFSCSFLERKEPKELQKDEEIEKAKRP